MASVALQNATLKKGKDGEAFPASQLWQDGPVLVVVLRRPGCLLCREEAIQIWNDRAKFVGVKLVCVVHEWIDREINAFAPEYWGGELYFDEAKAFYKAVHGGSLKKGSMLAMLSPGFWRNVSRAKGSKLVKDSNVNGDGMTLGGLILIKKGGDVCYSYGEKSFGDHAPQADVVAAAKAAASAS